MLQLREDFPVDQVQLCLDLVGADVVYGGDLLVHDQVLSAAGEPEINAHTHTPELSKFKYLHNKTDY